MEEKNNSSENIFNRKIIGNINLRLILDCILMLLILSGIAYFAHCRIRMMLNAALEEAVAKNAHTVAYELDKEFKLEVSSLLTLAGYLDENKLSPQDLVTALNDAEGKNAGIISSDGKLIAGDFPPFAIFETTRNSLDGSIVIRYLRGIGLVFSVPAKIDGEDCVLFDYYNDKAVRNKFRTISYNGDGTIIFLNNREDWTVLAEGLSLINTDPEMDAGREQLGEKAGWDKENGTLQKSSAAIFYEFKGQPYFIYCAVVSERHHFTISGYVPWESVAVGLNTIYVATLIVFSLLIWILFMFARIRYKTVENKSLRREKIYALQASKTKSDFLSNMSHEIRTPINAILGMDEMILRESKDEQILEYAENLRHAGNSLLGIVNDILDFSKIEAGKMEIIPVEYSLSSLLNDLVNMIKPRLDKKGLELKTFVNPAIPGILFGDEIRLKQIITNILTNAVKYTEYGSVTLTVDFERTVENKILLSVSVQDTGIGIKEEDLEKLFTAFERIEEKRNRSIEGTGLGMNITRQLLDLMHSKLEVASVYGEGSNFSFRVEQKIVNDEPIGNFTKAFRNYLRTHKQYREKFTAPNAKILVVDDTVMNLTVVKGLLKQTKIQIETVESGYECLNLVEKNHYDIIFLDHRMPGMDGIETLQKMKTLSHNKNRETPVISLTANAVSGAREQYIAAGFQDYLTKPINADSLENLIIKYLPPDLVQKTGQLIDEPKENSNVLPEFLKKVDGLHIDKGIEHCGGEEAYLDALTVFAEAVTSGADEIQNYFDKGDWKNYTTKVHALKSSAKVIGAEELSDRAKRLEDAGNSNYIDEIKQFTAPLLELYRSYAEKLSPLVKKESDDDTDKPLIEPDALAEAYETLREVAGSFDYDSVNFVLQSLDEYKLPEDDAKKISGIKSAVNKLDWDEVKKLLEN